MDKVMYEVPAIACRHCVHTIEREIGMLEGISYVEASEEEKWVKIEFDEPTTAEQIIARLELIHYPPKARSAIDG